MGALKRHDHSVEVVVQACYAIHFLCFAQNNISWMGANGACEAVAQALQKHIQDDIITTQVVVVYVYVDSHTMSYDKDSYEHTASPAPYHTFSPLSPVSPLPLFSLVT